MLLSAALGVVGKAYRATLTDRNRLVRNQATLLNSVTHYKTAAGQEAASVLALELRCKEYERLRSNDARRIQELGIKLSRVEATATLSTKQRIEAAAKLRYGDYPVSRHGMAARHSETVPLERCVLRSGRNDAARFGRMPRDERGHASANRTPHTAQVPVHPLGHESNPTRNRLDQPPHANRLCGICAIYATEQIKISYL